MDRITNENLGGILKRRLEVVLQQGHPDELTQSGIIEGYFFKDGWLNLMVAVDTTTRANASWKTGGVMIVELSPECEAIVRFVPEPDNLKL